MKDPVEALLPSSDRIFVVLRVEGSGDHVPFTLLDDPIMDIGHSSAIETSGERIVRGAHRLSNLRCQFSDGLKHGLAEFIQSPSFQPSVEGSAYTPAG